MNNRLPFILGGSILAASTLTFATGITPTPMIYQHDGFHAGILAGAGLGSVDTKNTYDNTLGTVFDTVNATTSSAVGKLGVSLGYGITLNTNNIIDFNFNYSHYLGTIKQESTRTPEIQVNISQKIRPQSQFNFEFNTRHFITQSVDLRVNTGFSILRLQNATTTSPAPGSDTVTGYSSTQTRTLFGGLIGMGFDYYLSRHTTISANANYFFYANGKFSNMNARTDELIPNEIDTLTNRRAIFSIPEITISYNYYF